MGKVNFEWNPHKDKLNQRKHGMPFSLAQRAFLDPNRIIAKDLKHSGAEERYYCFGKVDEGILTVCFTYRENVIRIISAGYWRKGKVTYEEQNRVY